MSLHAKIVFFSVLTAALVGAGTFLGVVYLSPKSTPLYVAHRGYSEYNPDNTPLAFTAATKVGFWGIETDVRKTADGVYVCVHDPDVKYEDGASLLVSENDYATLRAKPIRNDKTADKVYLCPFTEYLDICRKGKVTAVVELKQEYSDAEIAEILALVDEHYDRASCVFIDFNYGNLLRIKAADPSLPLQYLSQTKNDPTFDRCLEDGISIDVKYDVLKSSLVKKFHAKGLSVNVWTINTAWQRNRARRLKADYITTNLYHEN